MNEDRYRDEVRTLFYKLGYVDFYEKKLKSRNIIIRASAVDKLGKMLSEPSVGKLIEMLKTKNTETIAVTVRALSKIKSTEALKGILDHLPTLLHESLIAQKAMNTALTSFGVSAVPPLIECGRKHPDPRILSSILEVLSNTSADSAVCLFAVEHIKHSDAEIRAKALKVLGNVDTESIAFEQNLVLPLLEDPVWFVRLQAVRALGNLHYRKAIDFMGGLLLDQNWQVRDAAATALTKFGNDSIDIFLKILKYRDLYAKESICEEIEKTNFSSMLIENLASENREIQAKSREILHVMHSLHFSTPLREYLKRSKNEAIGQEIRLLINEGSEA
jgi:HEAT repeat protein